jgi:hypothetical protein
MNLIPIGILKMSSRMSRFNLLFSLPDALITDIFMTFDPTYRIFHTHAFRKELAGPGWLNGHKTSIKSRITEYFSSVMEDLEFCFKNEYGYIGEVDFDGGVSYEEGFQIYLATARGDLMYFKILPMDATKENCAFLRNPLSFDGCVCNEMVNQLLDDSIYGSNPRLRNEIPAPVATWVDGLCLIH